jgi:hypothetical protein
MQAPRRGRPLPGCNRRCETSGKKLVLLPNDDFGKRGVLVFQPNHEYAFRTLAARQRGTCHPDCGARCYRRVLIKMFCER